MDDYKARRWRFLRFFFLIGFLLACCLIAVVLYILLNIGNYL